VIPVKGQRPFFDEALQSLYAQDMGDDLEIIIQDGDVEPDKGQSDALNKGFSKARGECLFWLNADDVLLPGALVKVRDFINRIESVEWIVGNQLLIDDNGKVLECSVGNGWHDWLYRHSVPHVYGPSSFFRRELFEKVGGFDSLLHFCMDWDLWIKFMKVGAKFKRINDYLWAQRQWSGSKTQRKVVGAELEKHYKEINGMLERNCFYVNRYGVWLMRVWRILNGNYLKEFVDGVKWKGRNLSI
jgi:glycosyltransferase involved in cell wall biosynthesis